MVSSCGVKRTSYCALHLRAQAERMNNTNAHATIHNPYGIASVQSFTIYIYIYIYICIYIYIFTYVYIYMHTYYVYTYCIHTVHYIIFVYIPVLCTRLLWMVSLAADPTLWEATSREATGSQTNLLAPALDNDSWPHMPRNIHSHHEACSAMLCMVNHLGIQCILSSLASPIELICQLPTQRKLERRSTILTHSSNGTCSLCLVSLSNRSISERICTSSACQTERSG